MACWVGIGAQQPPVRFEPTTSQSQVWHRSTQPPRTISWGVNGHTTWCTSPVSVVVRLRLVSGVRLLNGDQRRPMGPLRLGKGLYFLLTSPSPKLQTKHCYTPLGAECAKRGAAFTLYKHIYLITSACLQPEESRAPSPWEWSISFIPCFVLISSVSGVLWCRFWSVTWTSWTRGWRCEGRSSRTELSATPSTQLRTSFRNTTTSRRWYTRRKTDLTPSTATHWYHCLFTLCSHSQCHLSSVRLSVCPMPIMCCCPCGNSADTQILTILIHY